MADQGAEGFLSPFLREKRMAAAKPYLRGRVLDVGCGAGALADYVEQDRYLGCDADFESLAVARSKHPGHKFQNSLPREPGGFDTIVSLAVIEHIANPLEFMKMVRLQLRPTSTSRIVLTTPNPVMGSIHAFGAKIGLFSLQANREHQKLLDRSALTKLAFASDCEVIKYSQFLYGANQLLIIAARK